MPHDEPLLQDPRAGAAPPAAMTRAQSNESLQVEYRAAFAGRETVLEDIFRAADLFAENTAAAHLQATNPIAAGVAEGKRRLALRIAAMALGGTDGMCKAFAHIVATAHTTAPAPKGGPRQAKTEAIQ